MNTRHNRYNPAGFARNTMANGISESANSIGKAVNTAFIEKTYKSLKDDKHYVAGIDELETFVQNHSEYRDIFGFKSLAEIEEICGKIQDRTTIDLKPVRDILPTSYDKFGEGKFVHIPKGDIEGFNLNNPKVEAGKNSPTMVTYMANLFTYFFTNVIVNKGNKLYVVGGIFPSFLLHQTLKDYDFIVVSGHKNMQTLLKHIAQYFMVFVAMAQGKGKLPQGNIMFTLAEPKKKNSDEIATRQYNVKIADEADDFEGLDFVLLRSVAETGEEENIADSYNNALSEDSLKQNLLNDAKRRETYLNALYGEMKMIDDRDETVIVCSDFYKAQDGLEEKYRQAFQNWQHIPTYGIHTFIGNMFRLNRIVKLYLKKYFDPEPSLQLLTIPANLEAIHNEIVTGNRNIYGDANNSYKKVIFELLLKKSEILLANDGNNVVMNKLLHILYYMPYLFGLDANKINQDKKLFETRCRQIILEYIDMHNFAVITGVFDAMKNHLTELETEISISHVRNEYITNEIKSINVKIAQAEKKLSKVQNQLTAAETKLDATNEKLTTLLQQEQYLQTQKQERQLKKQKQTSEENIKTFLILVQNINKDIMANKKNKTILNNIQREPENHDNAQNNNNVRDVKSKADKSRYKKITTITLKKGIELGLPIKEIFMALIVLAFILPGTYKVGGKIPKFSQYSGQLYKIFPKDIQIYFTDTKAIKTYLYLLDTEKIDAKIATKIATKAIGEEAAAKALPAFIASGVVNSAVAKAKTSSLTALSAGGGTHRIKKRMSRKLGSHKKKYLKSKRNKRRRTRKYIR
jgi:hypothetical protein